MPLQARSNRTETSSRAFVEFLISHSVVKPGFRQIFAGKDLLEIGRYLREKGMADQVRLTELYADFFQLPMLRLTNRPILPEVVRLIPKEISEKFRVLAYDLQGTNLYLGVARPDFLQQDAPQAISRLRQQKGLRIHLVVVPDNDLTAILQKVYGSTSRPVVMPPARSLPTPAVVSAPPPQAAPVVQPQSQAPATPKPVSPPPLPSATPNLAQAQPKPAESKGPSVLKKVEQHIKSIDLRSTKISEDVLSRIPYAVAQKYNIVVFGYEQPKSQFEPPLIKVGILAPEDQSVQEILSYIEQRNKVLVDRYKIDSESLKHVLGQYPDAPPTPTASQATPAQAAPAASAPKPVQAPAHVVPNVKPSEVKHNLPTPHQAAAKPAQEEVILEEANAVTPTPKPTVKKEEFKAAVAPIDDEADEKIEENEDIVVPSAPAAAKPASAAPAVSEETGSEAASVSVEQGGAGVVVSASEIVSRPAEESAEELQRLAKEQQSSLEDQNLDQLLRGPVLSAEELAKYFKSGVIPEMVAATLFLAIRMKASDVHIEAEQETVRLRFRIDGILHDIITVPHFLHAPLVSRIKILSKMKIDEQRVPQDGRFDVIIDKRQVDLRVSTLPTVHGEKVVMRLLDKSAGMLTLEQMGVTGTNFDTLISNVGKPYGIILSTGPTGSGKSTTLYAILTRISKPGVNIITLEDPVEYELGGINQAQVKPSIGFTFAEGLRSVLRQDPNIIMVGEIRDLETASMATHAALTGHLVLSTLHTNDAAGALPRLINMGVEPFLITSSINAVIGQRLVRRICPDCREKATIPPAVLNYVKKQLSDLPSGQMKNINLEQLVFYKGGGCKNCTNGYRGRIGIFEVLEMNQEIEDLSVKKAPASEIKKAAIRDGMITMAQDGLVKALKGITTVDEVMRVTTTQNLEIPVE